MAYDDGAIEALFAAAAAMAEADNGERSAEAIDSADTLELVSSTKAGQGASWQPQVWFARSFNFEHMDEHTYAAASKHGFELTATHNVRAGGVLDSISQMHHLPCVDENTAICVFKLQRAMHRGIADALAISPANPSPVPAELEAHSGEDLWAPVSWTDALGGGGRNV